MIDSGAAAWLGNLFVTQLTALTVAPPVVIVLIVVAVALVHLAITNLAACMALLIPIAVTIAEAAHLNPLVCGLVVTIAVDAIILYPVQTAANLLAYEAGYFHTADVRRLGVGMLVLTIVVALLVLPYWGLLAPAACATLGAVFFCTPLAAEPRPALGSAAGSAKAAMHDKVDVLIIGAGASGAAVAWSLAETQHAHPLPRARRLDESHRLSRAPAATGRRGCSATSPQPEPPRAARPTIRSTTTTRRSRWSNFNGVGGSTILYTAHFPRLHPSDFQVRTLDGVADDWPIDYATLEPFFAANDRMMGVSGLAGDPGLSAASSRRCRRCRSASSGETLGARRSTSSAGTGGRPTAPIATRRLRGPRARASISATARRAARRAPRRAPTSPIGRAALRAGVELRTRCRVREITTDEHGMASTASSTTTPTASSTSSRAEVVILACNGVGTPRLLLNSKSGAVPRTVSPIRSGLVGKNLMFHPYAHRLRLCRRAARQQPGPAGSACGARSSTRPIRRAASCAATPSSSRAARADRRRRITSMAQRAGCRGATDHHRAYRRAVQPHRVGLSASARTCRRSITA